MDGTCNSTCGLQSSMASKRRGEAKANRDEVVAHYVESFPESLTAESTRQVLVITGLRDVLYD